MSLQPHAIQLTLDKSGVDTLVELSKARNESDRSLLNRAVGAAKANLEGQLDLCSLACGTSLLGAAEAAEPGDELVCSRTSDLSELTRGHFQEFQRPNQGS